VVVDPVGGDRFTDSIRTLREGGRVVVLGFTGGSIPEVKVNRLLLANTEVVGAGWGAYVMGKPELTREIGSDILNVNHPWGGKALHLAALMDNRGRVLACDIVPAKLDALAELPAVVSHRRRLRVGDAAARRSTRGLGQSTDRG